MKSRLRHLTILLIFAIFAACAPNTHTDDKRPPSFLKVGTSYEGNLTFGPLRFTVVELGSGPWVKAQIAKENMGVRWLNTDHFFAITESK